MNGDPLVSVCMPCHNAARYVREALDSVLAQTYRNIEIVAVDDGSTDETGAILDDYAARAGVRAIHATLGNAAKARNLACRHSRGAFVKFFDADDLLSREMVALQVERLRENTTCVASAGWTRFWDAPEAAVLSPDQTWRDLPAMEWLLESLRGGGRSCMMQCGMFLFPRGLLEAAGGWDERLSLIDDLEFHTRVLTLADRILHTDSTLYYRSGLPGSLSKRKSRSAYESAALSTMSAIDRLTEREDSARVRRVAADLLQALYYELGPLYPEIAAQWRLAERVAELGGSAVSPSGGPVFHALSRVVGWRATARLRSAAIDGGYARLLARLRSRSSAAGGR